MPLNMQIVKYVPAVLLCACAFVFFRRQMQYWLPAYLIWFFSPKEKPESGEPIHILFCLVNHMDIGIEGASKDRQKNRMDMWVEKYPEFASEFTDSHGRILRQTWFFPPHYDHSGHLKRLVELCKKGFGEIELHLHHDHILPFKDTSKTLKEKIERCLEDYSRYGIFQPVNGGRKRYGFIHGDWALDNSRRKGKYCGVNDEISILKATGCYADFTFPCLHESQPRKANSIYYAIDNADGPKSHNNGRDVEALVRQDIGLMIIQGPMGLRWDERKFSIFPRIEDGALESFNPPTNSRVDLWIKTGIHVKRRPNWIIVKVYTHGGDEGSIKAMLGPAGKEMFSYLGSKYNDGKRYFLHYVTARELYNMIKAAEDGKDGNPSDYKDYVIQRYYYHI